MADDRAMNRWPIPEPIGVHPNSAAGRGYGMIIDDESYVLWCSWNQCGAVFAVSRGVWTMTRPITFKEFLSKLKADGVITVETFEMRRWIKACMLASVGPVD